jgi:hypothetical protein
MHDVDFHVRDGLLVLALLTEFFFFFYFTFKRELVFRASRSEQSTNSDYSYDCRVQFLEHLRPWATNLALLVFES